MVFNFTGDMSSMRETQKEFITKVLQERGFNDCEVLVKPMGKTGGNYASFIKKITINTNSGNTFKMIAKLAPNNLMARKMLNAASCFKNEHVMYQEIFPKYAELQKNAGITENERFRYAECYGTFMEPPNEVILLEDLKESHFCTLDKQQLLNNVYVKAVLKSYAIFHSLSFVLKNRHPSVYVDVTSKLGNNKSLSEIIQWREESEKMAIALIEDERYKSTLRGSLSNYHILAEQLEKQSTYFVIQQGDAWITNIMFVLEDNQPSKCILIDYQMAKENNPMYDIMHFIFNCTETEQRIQYYNEFIDYYYSELDKSLNHYGLEANDVYPRAVLNNDMKRYAKIVLGISILVAKFVTISDEEAHKIHDYLKNSNESLATIIELSPESQRLFANKLNGLIKSFIDLKFL